MFLKTHIRNVFFALGLFGVFTPAVNAYQGQMGTGIPTFGVYSAALTGSPYIAIWSLSNGSFPMAPGCPYLLLTVSTMGLETYKAALSILTTAVIANRTVQFFSHSERDGGCGVDYIRLN